MRRHIMSAYKPEEYTLLLAQAINAGDPDAAAALYEPGASMVPEPGREALTGTEAIRAIMNGFTSLKGKLNIEVKKVVQAGDLALMHNEWSLTDATGPDGKPISMNDQATDVLRRQPDGTWLCVLDSAWRP
jgi:uncharacterized protein (TIGR02246 family)